MSQGCLLDVRFPGLRAASAVSGLSIVAGVAALVAAAQVKLPFPGTDVPLTLQTSVLMVLGFVLGARRAASAAAIYAVGAMAMPHLSATANFTATGGFILGFVPAVWIAGKLFERGFGRSLFLATAAMMAAKVALFVSGITWLAIVAGRGFDGAISTGLVPFLPVEAAKIVAAVVVMRLSSRIGDRVESSRI